MKIGARHRTAIMCAEAFWWRCHRRIVADHLLSRGIPVVHLFTKAHAEAAESTPFAVVDRKSGTVTYPGAAPTKRSARRIANRTMPSPQR
jgi:hypothetical protein